MMNSYHRTIVFVPACLLYPELMAKKTNSENNWRNELLSYFKECDYSLVSMPCPEATFSDPQCGINRKPHGIKFYESLLGFDEYCSNLADQVIAQIEAFIKEGYCIKAIMGIEHSPTCSVNYMYTNLGTQKRKGIFIKHLSKELEHKGIDIQVLGINRKHFRKVTETLKLIEDKERNGIG